MPKRDLALSPPTDMDRWRRLVGLPPKARSSGPIARGGGKLTMAAEVEMPGSKEERWVEDAARFGDIRVDVVGESHYQPAIRSACGYKLGTDTLFECMAELVPEPANKFDALAIMVRIDGECVGHLSREDARTFGPAIREAVERMGNAMCRAVIAGHAHSETDNLGVFLHLNASVE